MAFEEVLMQILQAYTPALAFVAGLMLGDALILLGALAGAGKLNIFVIFIFGLIGELVHDSVFFYLAKSNFIYYVKRKLKLHKGRNKAAELIEKLAGTRAGYFVPLFFAKFIYGVRDSVVLYIGHKEKNFKKYFLRCLLASILSIAIIISLGWLAGRGFTEIIHVFKGIEKGVGLLLISLFVAYVLYRLIGKAVLGITRKYLKKLGMIS